MPRTHTKHWPIRILAILALGTACIAWAADKTPSQDPWGPTPKAPANAPIIVLILLDDVGYADPSSFGGVAQTATLDRIANEGIRFTNFNTTGMCSPTRASLLSGHNHHAVGFGRVADWATDTPGYNSAWNPQTASIARILKDRGYSTAAIGKWHNTPEWEVSPVGPFDRWPTGLGFEYFYGFMNPGGDNPWEPSSLYRGTTPVEPVHTPGIEYHLTTDLVDHAMHWVHTHQALAPDKPYFLYFATGGTHAPHQVPADWVAKYRGKFDQGWDVLREEIFARQKRLGIVPPDTDLTPRPAEVPAWDALSADEKTLYARQMEVFAAYLAHTDYEVGRLVDDIRKGPGGDNTLVIYVVGDNGASGMEGIQGLMDNTKDVRAQLAHLDELGSAKHFNDYSAAWAWVGSTPFRWMKEVASHFGGLRVAMAISWPTGMATHGGTFGGFTHTNDVVPTVLQLIGIAAPATVDGIKQLPMDGVSFADALKGKPIPPAHRVQYFEMLGNRALYSDGWMASARHMTLWLKPFKDSFDADTWELFDLSKDFSQAHDLAKRYPDKLAAMKAQFDREARRNHVYPLANYVEGKDYGAPTAYGSRTQFDFVPPMPRIPTKALPKLPRHSFTLTANVEVPETGADGVLVQYGSRLGGFAWYVRQGRLTFANNVGGNVQEWSADSTLQPGTQVLKLTFKLDADGKAGVVSLFEGERLVGQRRVEKLGASVLGSFGVGRGYTSAVSSAYALPFGFSGRLRSLALTLDRDR
ncbi:MULTISPECIES: arylsulfatase [Dyella]|uniref:Arylsulfatase n=2 Tax=Dyella TaxID=231454 RepID=A0A4R0YIY7_9GAMM|nr:MULTISPECIES: arylsulfatase [Dyella]TBR36055.1 arylsulfatase [Dyella terrae]TCI06105.1 arylsulfatase [Dyella soli]